jgi:pSer/pThr/pTyr-binding forkhead associated (FHA) protein
MKFSLRVLTQGKQEGKLLEIKLPQFLIGRDPQCHLRPASALISKRHCVLIQRDGKAFIRDFDSTNGTFVNDEPVKGERELHNEDSLKVGPIEFKVELEQTVASSSKTPAPPTKAATIVKPAVGNNSDGAKVADSTPVPVTSAIANSGKGSAADDDIAAMLLSLEGDDGGGPSLPLDASGVPEGSTVMELKLPPEVAAAAGAEQKDDKKAQPPKGASGDTRSAAASILEKMMKRPRT